jgi:hypothetical protein
LLAATSPEEAAMDSNAPHNLLQDPTYLRDISSRLRQIITSLGDPDARRAIAEHSFNLAQRAEIIARLAAGDPSIIRANVGQDRSIVAPDMPALQSQTVECPADQAEDAVNGHQALRELARWYREFAESAGNPAIWDARLRTADDLDAEADRIERMESRRSEKNT